MYCSVIVIIKLSILLQYISIFMPHRQGLAYIVTHVLIWINVIYFTIHAFTYIFGVSIELKGKGIEDADLRKVHPER